MKGIVFTEFLEFIEMHHGYDLVDEIIEETKPYSGGIYTAVGSYPFSELLTMLISFTKKTGLNLDDALELFGQHLFETFKKNYPVFFEKCNTSFEFLSSIDNYIHIEVAKLYPDAELPKFKATQVDDQTLELYYTSERKLAHLAKGLIEKTFLHYNEKGTIDMHGMSDDGTEVKFILKIV